MERNPDDVRLNNNINEWVRAFKQEVEKRSFLSPEDRGALTENLGFVGPKQFSFELPASLANFSAQELLARDLNNDECKIVCAYALHMLGSEEAWLKVLDVMSKRLVQASRTEPQEERKEEDNNDEEKAFIDKSCTMHIANINLSFEKATSVALNKANRELFISPLFPLIICSLPLKFLVFFNQESKTVIHDNWLKP